MTKIVAEQNPFNNTWDVGWKSDDGVFAPEFCGYATREQAEAEIPGFDERVRRNFEEYRREQEAFEREQNEQWPNIGRVRSQIKKLAARGRLNAAFDASDKLDWLLNCEKHQYVDWPLPSWKKIKAGHVGFGWGP
jgi:hypothetical protein